MLIILSTMYKRLIYFQESIVLVFKKKAIFCVLIISDGDPLISRKRILVHNPYLVQYLLDVLSKKIKVLDILNTDKKCL